MRLKANLEKAAAMARRRLARMPAGALTKDIVRHAGDAAHTGGIYRPGIKVRYFRVIDPKGLTRHGRKLPKGARFWVKKSSSTAHIDRWLGEGRIKEVSTI